MADFTNLASIASNVATGKETIVVFDDYDLSSNEGLSAAWNNVKRQGYVGEIVSCQFAQDTGTLPHSVGFAFGKIVKRPNRSALQAQ